MPRECGSCSLCCKLIAVVELTKIEGSWCAHCKPGNQGCQIYENRPSSCRGFECGWLQTDDFGPEWKPTSSKMVIAAEGEGNRLTIYVDPSFPTNWRKEPYYSQLRNLAVQLIPAGTQLLVRINDRGIALLPDKEIDLGRFRKDDHIVIFQTNVGEWGARLVLAENMSAEHRGKWTRRKRAPI